MIYLLALLALACGPIYTVEAPPVDEKEAVFSAIPTYAACENLDLVCGPLAGFDTYFSYAVECDRTLYKSVPREGQHCVAFAETCEGAIDCAPVVADFIQYHSVTDHAE